METDTIRKGAVFHLADEPAEIAATYDHETGSATYRIAIVPDEVTVTEENDSHNSHIFWWSGVALAIAITMFFVVRYILKNIAATIEKQNKANRILR